MLDQDAEKSFDRTEQGTMNHDRAMFLIVVADIFDLKAFGQIEIELDGR
jgi:hypothetical protein